MFSNGSRYCYLTALVALAASVAPENLFAANPKVAEGFSIRLVAEVPAVRSPSQVATAPDGSLFVAEDPMDQEGPYESRKGRILLFREGKDPIIFAEDFRAIFGMAWRDGSLYVSHMPFLSVLKDTDNDGKADARVELFHDLGITNNAGLNDHIVSGLRFGLDNRLYISVGDKGILGATGPDGRKVQLVGGGVLRCFPDGTGLELLSSGTRNHLEANLDARDNIFTYDNTDDGGGWWTRVSHHVDSAYFGYPYDYHKRTDRMLPRIAEYGGGSPCGAIFYGEDAWPETYRGRLIWSEWAKRSVRAFKFKPKGASFDVEDVIELAEAGDSPNFRPLDLALSYDGKSLYIADWGMGGWGSKTEKVGKIYAVTYDGEMNPTPRRQDSDPASEQIKSLAHPSFNERMRAQNALMKLGKSDESILSSLIKLVGEGMTDAVMARHLVWTIDGIAGGSPEVTKALIGALKSEIADVRGQAARALGMRQIAAAEESVRASLSDLDDTVKLNAIIALGRIGDKASVPYLLNQLASSDVYLSFTAREALRRIGNWEATASGLESADPKIRLGVLSTLELVFDKDAASLLAKYSENTQKPDNERAKAIFYLAQGFKQTAPWDGKWWGTRPTMSKPPAKSVAWAGTPLAYETVRARLSDPKVAVRLAAVEAVQEIEDIEALPFLRNLYTAESESSVKLAMIEAIGVLKDTGSIKLLSATLKEPKASSEIQGAVLTSLEAIGGSESAKALIELLDGGIDADRQSSVLAALGRMKSKEAVGAIVAKLKSDSAKVRATGLTSLGQIGQKQGVLEALHQAFQDKDPEVLKSAIAAATALKDRESIPDLIVLANNEATRFEASRALAALPDARALKVYVRALADKSPELRNESAKALGASREQAAALLDQLAARNELPTIALPELRKVFGTMTPIRKWHVVGPFAINERQPFETNKPVDLEKVFDLPDGVSLKWSETTAVDDHGQVDLTRVYTGNLDKKAAYGYAELEVAMDQPVTMAVGSDDTLTVWLNGKQIHNINGSRGFEPEQARYDVQLKKGINRIVVKCGNQSGPWAFAVAFTRPGEYAFLQGPAAGSFDSEAYRAVAAKGEGKSEKGKSLFMDLKGLACVKCHAVGGQGGAVGPDLAGIALRYPREELITSILYPSAKISSGYEPVVFATSTGQILTGIIKSETPQEVEIEDAEAKRVKILKSEIEERKISDISIMPTGLAAGIGKQDFADLIAYLETLKEAPSAKVEHK